MSRKMLKFESGGHLVIGVGKDSLHFEIRQYSKDTQVESKDDHYIVFKKEDLVRFIELLMKVGD